MVPDISGVIEVLLYFWELCFKFLEFRKNQTRIRPLNPLLLMGLVNIITVLEHLFHLNEQVRKWKKRRLKSYNAIKLINGFRWSFYFTVFIYSIKKQLFWMFIYVRSNHCRANFINMDFWNILENNWTHFYCLTGEIPPTLTILVIQVQQNYNRLLRGRRCVLSFRDQVMSSTFRLIDISMQSVCLFITIHIFSSKDIGGNISLLIDEKKMKFLSNVRCLH